MSKIKPELIHITSITVLKSNIETTESYIDDPVEFKNIKVQCAQDSAFNFDDNAVRVRIDISLISVDENDEPIGLNAEYTIEFIFIVENFDEFVIDMEDHKEVEGILGNTIMSIAYSTARGMVLERTQGTYFNGIILPVIDPKSIIK